MTPSNDALKASYAFCRRLSRRAGSNFYLGFWLLPREKRRAMDALYAFMRHTDDLVDVDAPPGAENDFACSTARRREQLRRWRAALQDALAGDDKGSADVRRVQLSSCADNKSAEIMLLPALVDSVKRFQVPEEYLFAVFDGVETDLDRNRYATFDELKEYCERVASAVGLACIHIWGFRGRGTPTGKAALVLARAAGIALQLTNILRDLKADAAADRIYLPLEDLRASGYSVDELKQGVVNTGFHRLVRCEIERAEQFYREGCRLFDFLDRDGQRIFSLMISAYWRLLKKIARRPERVCSRAVRLGVARRVLLATACATAPSAMIRNIG